MEVKKIRVGSRDSKLAVIQSQMVMDRIKAHHPELELELVTMKTTGDIILDKTLDKIGGKGLFVKELDKALMDGTIDISVHSLKDMPMEVPEALPLLAYMKRENPADALVLPEGAENIDERNIIGSSSKRRNFQLRELYTGMEEKSIRGNVITRLSKLDNGHYSALVLACAGLVRLGLEDRISKVFGPDEMIPAAGQGILVVQGRAGEDHSYLDCVNDLESQIAAEAERAFVTVLDGGCSSPVGAYAELDGDEVTIRGFYCEEDGTNYRKGKVVGKREDAVTLAEKLARDLKGQEHTDKKKGKVWLVGAGPSDAGLMTLKGKDVIEQADVVVYDKLVGQGVMALVPSKTERIAVGKVAGHHPIPQHEINRILLEEALKGKKVVRLKGGDPFVFGRGGEELELLCEHGIPFEIVPGITSAVSVPAYNGIPVTHRDYCSSLHIITGHTKKEEEPDIDYEALVRLKGTLMFLMGVTSMPVICRGLLDAGMRPDMPAAILERGTTAHQRRVISDITNLPSDAAKAGIGTPAIIVVGEVCRLSEQFAWAEHRELGGMKVAVTRPRDRSSKLAGMLADLGAEVVLMPTIETEAILENGRLFEKLEQIEEYRWIAFTSPAGAKIFFEEMGRYKMDIRRLCGIRFAAIGPATKRVIEEKGMYVDLMPEVYTGEELGKLLASRIVLEEEQTGQRSSLLIPRAKAGTEEVTRPLVEAGIVFDDLAIYETVEAVPEGEGLYDATVDYVAFTSASTVRGFAKLYPDVDTKKVKAVCIGHQTAKEAEKLGMEIHIAKEATMASMVELLKELK